MDGREKIKRRFTVTVDQPAEGQDIYRLRYAARGLQYARGAGGRPAQTPVFVASARFQGEGVAVTWENPPSDHEVTSEEFNEDARSRVRTLRGWIDLLNPLVAEVEEYAKGMSWATCWMDKRMEDSQIGKYTAPGLIMQEAACRITLEPIARTAPGTDGVVDLYLTPAYDDIASLYHYDGRWNLHYMHPDTPAAANTREAPGEPLSKEALQKILDEMKKKAT